MSETLQVMVGQVGKAQAVLAKVLEGITQEESLVTPPGGGNAINWIVGHIVTSRNSMIQLLGGQAISVAGLGDQFRRGAQPDATRALPLTVLAEAAAASAARLAERLGTANDSDFARQLPDGKGTLGDRLSLLLFHDGYHVGQVGVLRRTLDKPGAIG